MTPASLSKTLPFTLSVAGPSTAVLQVTLLVVLAVASALLVPLPVAGLALALLVAVLAFVNVAFGYCLGCQIYYQLGKAGVIRAS